MKLPKGKREITKRMKLPKGKKRNNKKNETTKGEKRKKWKVLEYLAKRKLLVFGKIREKVFKKFLKRKRKFLV